METSIRKSLDAVTGAFSYTGNFIARRLLAEGRQVITLTNHLDREDALSGQIHAYPYAFEQPDRLTHSLEDVDTLYNTYWVRFSRGEVNFDLAVQNTRVLLQAAKQAGVRRVVHISVTNPSFDTQLPYFRGKWQVEQAVQSSGLSFAILRPTLIFGPGDILVNNIAYLLRRLPFFVIPGDGKYEMQPVYGNDLADLAMRLGAENEDLIIDAAGPERLPFDQWVNKIAAAVGRRARLVYAPPALSMIPVRVLSLFLMDVLLTTDEVKGLMAGLLVSFDPPSTQTTMSDWLVQHGSELGLHYASEVKRHFH